MLNCVYNNEGPSLSKQNASGERHTEDSWLAVLRHVDMHTEVLRTTKSVSYEAKLSLRHGALE